MHDFAEDISKKEIYNLISLNIDPEFCSKYIKIAILCRNSARFGAK
jgi:hypothetical protein